MPTRERGDIDLGTIILAGVVIAGILGALRAGAGPVLWDWVQDGGTYLWGVASSLVSDGWQALTG